jgi:hypothetical protein
MVKTKDTNYRGFLIMEVRIREDLIYSLNKGEILMGIVDSRNVNLPALFRLWREHVSNAGVPTHKSYRLQACHPGLNHVSRINNAIIYGVEHAPSAVNLRDWRSVLG